MAFSAEILLQLTANEPVGGIGVSANTVVTQDALNAVRTLSSTSSPPATKSSYFTQALSAGSATIDLTSLPNYAGTAGAVTFNGLKLQGIIFSAPATNTAAVVLAKAGSNGYGLDSAGATWTLPISPGAKGVIMFDDELPDVGSGARNIALSGTGSETVSLGLIAG